MLRLHSVFRADESEAFHMIASSALMSLTTLKTAPITTEFKISENTKIRAGKCFKLYTAVVLALNMFEN